MNSFGHFGYTGTYAWADPDKEIIIVILAKEHILMTTSHSVKTMFELVSKKLYMSRLLIKR